MKASFGFVPVRIIRKYKFSLCIFADRQADVNNVLRGRHSYSHHNGKFSVAFVPYAVNIAVAGNLPLAFLAQNVYAAPVLDKTFFRDGVFQRPFGKFLRKNLQKFAAHTLDRVRIGV